MPDNRLHDLAADWRATLNAICDLVGHPRISPDEGGTASVAERVRSLSRDHGRLVEAEEHCRSAHGGDWQAKLAASQEHHDEHHRREEELEVEIARLKEALLAIQGHALELCPCSSICECLDDIGEILSAALKESDHAC